jgi:DNA helicase-2/ATP-dependent DNA helicase PcrA
VTDRTANLLSILNPAQRTAATIKDGPAVVFAGAGSGKTRIITTRIAWLIEMGVRPWEILAVTFTNKAAGEMRARLVSQCPDAERALVTTFHSACAKWLREFASELGFTSDFTIYDDSDSLSLIRKTMKRAEFSIEKDTTPAELKSAINHVKTMGYLPSDAKTSPEIFKAEMPSGGLEVYKAYQQALALANAMDFGDLILNVLLLLRTNERVKRALQERFQYILIDEYQDTNRPQMELIETLSARHRNIFVVGDDDQSIYSWRGAVPSNILKFDQTFPGSQVCKLEENYRSTSTIVDAAAAVVSHNKTRAEKTLRTKNLAGDLIGFRYESDAEFEAWWVASQIQEERMRFPYTDVAVFYRTNSQSRLLEDAMLREKIPYRIYGTVRFYERAEIKDILSYLRIIVNPRDDVSFFRALNTPARGMGDAVEAAIAQKAGELGVCLMEAARVIAESSMPRISSKLANFFSLFDKISVDVLALSMPEVIEYLVDAIDYTTYLEKKFPDQAKDKEDNVMELASAMTEYSDANPAASISQWLQDISLASDSTGNEEGVTLMTLHMAKGLEFERVFLVGFEDGLLPHFNSLDDDLLLEEERRLLYVGMTRAKKKLTLTAAQIRRTWGQTAANNVSRFFSEIPESSMQLLSELQPQKKIDADDEDQDVQYYDYDDESPSSSQDIKVGRIVQHPTYGSGTVEEIQSTWGKPKIIVRFEDFGLRRVDPHHLGSRHSRS